MGLEQLVKRNNIARTGNERQTGRTASQTRNLGSGTLDPNDKPNASALMNSTDNRKDDSVRTEDPKSVVEQRVFVKISPQAENSQLLIRLKEMLQKHPGPVATVLFYQQSQKLLALSDQYRIKPTPELFEAMEQMLGSGTVRIK